MCFIDLYLQDLDLLQKGMCMFVQKIATLRCTTTGDRVIRLSVGNMPKRPELTMNMVSFFLNIQSVVPGSTSSSGPEHTKPSQSDTELLQPAYQQEIICGESCMLTFIVIELLCHCLFQNYLSHSIPRMSGLYFYFYFLCPRWRDQRISLKR